MDFATFEHLRERHVMALDGGCGRRWGGDALGYDFRGKQAVPEDALDADAAAGRKVCLCKVRPDVHRDAGLAGLQDEAAIGGIPPGGTAGYIHTGYIGGGDGSELCIRDGGYQAASKIGHTSGLAFGRAPGTAGEQRQKSRKPKPMDAPSHLLCLIGAIS
ncbi:hypothetical protein F183_A52480 [Bryobacterales bacterium F-183]|nr:hypothetical protein F183_A52480 [Bryobacterales bacterium F-183]